MFEIQEVTLDWLSSNAGLNLREWVRYSLCELFRSQWVVSDRASSELWQLFHEYTQVYADISRNTVRVWSYEKGKLNIDDKVRTTGFCHALWKSREISRLKIRMNRYLFKDETPSTVLPVPWSLNFCEAVYDAKTQIQRRLLNENGDREATVVSSIW
jgi:hypothetical protein